MMPTPQGPLIGCRSFETACVSSRIARSDDIDELGHVNNAVYVRWVQDAAVGHWFAVAPDDIASAHVWVAGRHEIDYRGEVKEGDEVEIRTWLGEVKGAQFARHTDIRIKGSKRPAAEALTWWVLVDAEKRRPRRVNTEMLALFGL